jgi:sulfur dioxygenase
MQNYFKIILFSLRAQLGLRAVIPTGPAFNESERIAAEQKLTRLKTEAENKRTAIQNLKSALENLEITE